MSGKQLVRFVPDHFEPDESEKPEIFVTPPIRQWLYQKDGTKSADYKINIRTHLSRFVKEFEIDNEWYMKSWKLDLFEMRIQLTNRKENTRIFGGFLLPDVFICTNYEMRSRVDFEAAIGKSDAMWASLFPGVTLINANPFSDCVTFNFYDVHERTHHV